MDVEKEESKRCAPYSCFTPSPPSSSPPSPSSLSNLSRPQVFRTNKDYRPLFLPSPSNLHLSSFISSFILHPSSFILHPSSFILFLVFHPIDHVFRLEELRGLIGDLTTSLNEQLEKEQGVKRRRTEDNVDAIVEAIRAVSTPSPPSPSFTPFASNFTELFVLLHFFHIHPSPPSHLAPSLFNNLVGV